MVPCLAKGQGPSLDLPNGGPSLSRTNTAQLKKSRLGVGDDVGLVPCVCVCVCVVVVVVVEIIKLYQVQTGRFSATTGYVAPSPNHVQNNVHTQNVPQCSANSRGKQRQTLAQNS